MQICEIICAILLDFVIVKAKHKCFEFLLQTRQNTCIVVCLTPTKCALFEDKVKSLFHLFNYTFSSKSPDNILPKLGSMESS